jgi:hypothetical protein
MPEWVVRNKSFELVSDGAEVGPKIDLYIYYEVTNGTDQQTIPEVITHYAPGDVTAAQLTTREAAVLLALNS